MGKKYYIYKHQNIINGKIYIGQTCQESNRRWRPNGDGYKDSEKFYWAIQKYGWENFSHEIIETGEGNDWANEREIYWIKFYDSYKNGYNATPGGQNYMSIVWENPEFKNKMRKTFSETRKNYPQEKKDEIVNKMVEGIKKAWGTPEWREKRIQDILGSKNPNAKAVINLETLKVFSTCTEAAHWGGLNSISGIGQCCKKQRKTSSKHPETGESLHWMYLKDWQVMQKCEVHEEK